MKSTFVPKRRILLAASAAAGLQAMGGPFSPAFAATSDAAYPNRPIRFIVPFPPGSGTELTARFMASKISELVGQPVIVEPRGGGNGFIGVQVALAAPRDGYTIFFGSNSTLATNAALFRKLPYDPIADFAPLSLVMLSPMMLVVPPNSRFKTLADLIQAARAAPDTLTIGSGSSTYQLVGDFFADKAGIKLIDVPYKSAAETALAVASGQVDVGVAEVTTVLGLIRGNRVRCLVVASDQRLPVLPDVPSSVEAGVEGFTLHVWCGAAAPAGVPKPIVDKLSDLFMQVQATQAAKDFFKEQHVLLQKGGQDELRVYQKEEIAKWKRIATNAHVQLQ